MKYHKKIKIPPTNKLLQLHKNNIYKMKKKFIINKIFNNIKVKEKQYRIIISS